MDMAGKHAGFKVMIESGQWMMCAARRRDTGLRSWHLQLLNGDSMGIYLRHHPQRSIVRLEGSAPLRLLSWLECVIYVCNITRRDLCGWMVARHQRSCGRVGRLGSPYCPMRQCVECGATYRVIASPGAVRRDGGQGLLWRCHVTTAGRSCVRWLHAQVVVVHNDMVCTELPPACTRHYKGLTAYSPLASESNAVPMCLHL